MDIKGRLYRVSAGALLALGFGALSIIQSPQASAA